MPEVGIDDRVDVVWTAGGSPLIRRQGVVVAVERTFIDVAAPFTGSDEPLRVLVADLAAQGFRHWRARREVLSRAPDALPVGLTARSRSA